MVDRGVDVLETNCMQRAARIRCGRDQLWTRSGRHPPSQEDTEAFFVDSYTDLKEDGNLTTLEFCCRTRLLTNHSVTEGYRTAYADSSNSLLGGPHQGLSSLWADPMVGDPFCRPTPEDYELDSDWCNR
jgi:hypothetical protein